MTPGANRRHPSRDDEFVVAHRFMWRDHGLSGVTLLVYARIYGFCKDGGEFFESRSATADFLGTTPRTVTRAIDDLLEANLISEAGTRETGNGRRTRSYRITGRNCPENRLPSHDEMSPDELSPDELSPDNASPPEALNPDGSSGLPVTGCHPIKKEDNKWFR